ncbi:Pyranose 2-oxidase [Cladobotryum mycophilum]|uniref:Pyranose 2-oxidase n=1 Tax=Cladobotryum mycophilum TaxID=491253 RepID=A0ABR0SY43_9HYPO
MAYELASIEYDVLIVGSGPIGAVFARRLVDADKKVAMIDIGDQATRKIGDHKKNSVAVQKNISLFTNIVKGDLQPLSVPTTGVYHSIEPSSCFVRSFDESGFVINGQNPEQKAALNLPEAAATRVIGGMGSHWTCCTPRQHVKLERPDLFTKNEWHDLYSEAERLFRTNSYSFDDSIRQTVIKETLSDAYKDREIKSMPLACRRSETNTDYVEWTCTATILKELSDPTKPNSNFQVLPNTQCVKIELSANDAADVNGNAFKVTRVEVRDLMKNKTYHIKAKQYVICASAVLTPSILFNSGFRSYADAQMPLPGPPTTASSKLIPMPAFGRYMTEQTLAFCQVVLKKTLLEGIKEDQGGKRIAEHQAKNPKDPIPLPFNDPDPQCYFPLMADFRWFGYTKPELKNYVTFSEKVKDDFGMPQPIFHFQTNDEDAERCHEMITDMANVARKIGGFLPGAEPKFLAPGSALHICGTYRAGDSDKDSVVNKTGKVWNVQNLVLGGCGVIPTQNACNPTLTAACFAIAAARQLIKELEKDEDCDHLQPACSQCIKSGWVCPGALSSTDVLFKHNASSGQGNQQQPTLSNDGPVTVLREGSRVVDLSPSINDKGTAFFLREYVFDAGTSPSSATLQGFHDHLPALLQQEQTGGPLETIVSAAGLAALANAGASLQWKREAYSLYGKAIQKLQADLQDTARVKLDSTLAAIMMMGTFETIASADETSMESFSQHIMAGARCIQMRGPNQFTSEVSVVLFKQLRALISMTCHQLQEPLPYAIRTWLGWIESKQTDNEAPLNRFAMLNEQLAATRAEIKQKGIRDPMIIAAMLLPIDLLFKHWGQTLPDTWTFKSYRNLTSNVDETQCYKLQHDVYPNLGVATTWNNYRMVRLLIHESFITAAMRHESNQYEDHLQQSAKIMMEMANGICHSVPYTLGYRPGRQQPEVTEQQQPTPGACIMLWPLFLAGSLRTTPADQREWIAGTLRDMGLRMGLQLAMSMANKLEETATSFSDRETWLIGEFYPN